MLRVTDLVDLNRQVVKSEYAEIEIPELDLNIPPKTQAGSAFAFSEIMFFMLDVFVQIQCLVMRTVLRNLKCTMAHIFFISYVLNRQPWTVISRGIVAAITTVEGILQRVMEGLKQDQDERRKVDPKNAEKIENFLARVESLLALKDTFTLVCFI